MTAAQKAVRSFAPMIEIERKFVPGSLLKIYASEALPASRNSLPTSSLQPSSVALVRLPDKRMTDKYFDLNGQLEQRGIWVRWRQQSSSRDSSKAISKPGIWEAKVKQGGNYLDSQFEEVKGRDAVEACMAKAGVCTSIYDLSFSLGFVTDRVSWTIEGYEGAEENGVAMTLVLDTMSAALDGSRGDQPIYMHHQVGELEFEKAVSAETSKDDERSNGNEAKYHEDLPPLKSSQVEVMREQLTTFMAAYPTIFNPRAVPISKLSAYMQRENDIASRYSKANAANRLSNMSEAEYDMMHRK